MGNFLINLFRRSFFCIILLTAFSKAVLSQPTGMVESAEWKNPFKPDEVDKAIDSGIEFLLSNQKDNGAIYDRGNPTAITALSLMSLAAVGHLPIHPNENGKAMAKALEFILLEKNQDEVGFFGKDGGRMYGHGIVTLTLAEMLGMGMDEETDKAIREKCQIAIDLILRSQKIPKNQKHGVLILIMCDLVVCVGGRCSMSKRAKVYE